LNKNLSVTSLVEAKDPNIPSSSLTSPTSSTMIRVGVVGTIVLLNKIINKKGMGTSQSYTTTICMAISRPT
jgi:hypothetical protein